MLESPRYRIQDWGGDKIFLEKKLASGEVLQAGIFRCDPGKSLPLHTHDEGDEYCYLYEGSGVFVFGDKEYQVKEGELIKIPKGMVHRSYNTGEIPFQSFFIVLP